MPSPLTTEEQRLIDSYLASQVSDGATYDDRILADSKEFFTLDGNIDAFMLYYFPETFYSWEPIDTTFFDFLENNNEGQARLPAQHGKTSCILCWFAYVFCRCPDVSIVYTEKNLPTAQERCYSLMGFLQGERLVAHYGDFEGDQWSTKALTIRQRPRRIATPSLCVYGAGGGSVLGKRCNILVNDDPVTDENNSSENERNSLYRWYTKAAATAPTALPVLNPRYKKKHFLVGTVFGLDDLYHRVEKAHKSDPNYAFLHIRAVPDELTGATLSPRFCYISPEDLGRKAEEDPYYADLEHKIKVGDVTNLYTWRQMNGTWAFYQRYQNVAIDEANQKFPKIWFEGGKDEMSPPGGYRGCFDPGRELGEDRKDGWTYLTGVDPAAGSNTREAVRFACATIGYDPENPGEIHLVDLDYGRYPLVSDVPGKQTQVDAVLDHVQRYGSRIVLETNNIQKIYHDVLMQAARKRGMVLRVTGHYTSKDAKVNFEDGVDAMQPMVENGHLRLPWGKGRTQRKVQELVDEMQFLGNFGTDDIVMALWFGWRIANRAVRKAKQKFRPRVLPEYFNRGQELIFPKHWSREQQLAYMGLLNLKDEDEEDED